MTRDFCDVIFDEIKQCFCSSPKKYYKLVNNSYSLDDFKSFDDDNCYLCACSYNGRGEDIVNTTYGAIQPLFTENEGFSITINFDDAFGLFPDQANSCKRLHITRGSSEITGNKYLAINVCTTTHVKLSSEPKNGHINAKGKCLISPVIQKPSTIILHNDKSVYCAFAGLNSKAYPANVKNLACILPQDLLGIFFKAFAGSSMFYKDIIADSFYPPIPIENLSRYYSKKHYLESLFKINLPKSVNKISFERLYASCCAYKYVSQDKHLLAVLLNSKHSFSSITPSFNKRKQIGTMYLADYLEDRVPTVDWSVLHDYVEFSVDMRVPVDIYAGKRRIERLHDELNDLKIKKANRGISLKIPETPLKYLSLPKEFILLKTKSALYEEGKINHNCVGSYVDRINNGQCVIYSANIQGEHLTIEICYNKVKGKKKQFEFYVRQCYASYNRSCSDDALQYVTKSVEDSTQNAIRNYYSTIKNT